MPVTIETDRTAPNGRMDDEHPKKRGGRGKERAEGQGEKAGTQLKIIFNALSQHSGMISLFSRETEAVNRSGNKGLASQEESASNSVFPRLSF